MSTVRTDRMRAQAGIDAVASAISHHIGRGVDKSALRLEKLRRKRRAEQFGTATYAHIAASLSPHHPPATPTPNGEKATSGPRSPPAPVHLSRSQLLDRTSAAAAAPRPALPTPPPHRPVPLPREHIGVQTDEALLEPRARPPSPPKVGADFSVDPFALSRTHAPPQTSLTLTSDHNLASPLSTDGALDPALASPQLSSAVRHHMPLLLSPSRAPPPPPAPRVPSMTAAAAAATHATTTAATTLRAAAELARRRGGDQAGSPTAAATVVASRAAVASAASADVRAVSALGITPLTAWSAAASVWPSVIRGSEGRAVPAGAVRIAAVAREAATVTAAAACGEQVPCPRGGADGGTVAAPGVCGRLPLPPADAVADTTALAVLCKASAMAPSTLRATILLDPPTAPAALYAAVLAAAPSTDSLSALVRLPDVPPPHSAASVQAYADAHANVVFHTCGKGYGVMGGAFEGAGGLGEGVSGHMVGSVGRIAGRGVGNDDGGEGGGGGGLRDGGAWAAGATDAAAAHGGADGGGDDAATSSSNDIPADALAAILPGVVGMGSGRGASGSALRERGGAGGGARGGGERGAAYGGADGYGAHGMSSITQTGGVSSPDTRPPRSTSTAFSHALFPHPFSVAHLFPSAVDAGVAAQFWRDAAADMPSLRRRLAIQAFRSEFATRVESLTTLCSAVDRGVAEVVESSALRRVLEVVCVCVQGVSGEGPVVGLRLSTLQAIATPLSDFVRGDHDGDRVKPWTGVEGEGAEGSADLFSSLPSKIPAPLRAKIATTPTLLEVVVDALMCGGAADVAAASQWVKDIATLCALARAVEDDGSPDAAEAIYSASSEAGSDAEGGAVSAAAQGRGGGVHSPTRQAAAPFHGTLRQLLVEGGNLEFGTAVPSGTAASGGALPTLPLRDLPTPPVALGHVLRLLQHRLGPGDTTCDSWPLPFPGQAPALGEASLMRRRLDVLRRGLRLVNAAAKRIPLAHPADTFHGRCEEFLESAPSKLESLDACISKAEDSLMSLAGYFAADQTSDPVYDGEQAMFAIARFAQTWASMTSASR